MATISKKDVERLSGLYADRLTRNTRYPIEDMEELTGSEVWRTASDEHKRFLTGQIRDKAFKLLSDAGFPLDVVRRIREGKVHHQEGVAS